MIQQYLIKGEENKCRGVILRSEQAEWTELLSLFDTSFPDEEQATQIDFSDPRIIEEIHRRVWHFRELEDVARDYLSNEEASARQAILSESSETRRAMLRQSLRTKAAALAKQDSENQKLLYFNLEMEEQAIRKREIFAVERLEWAQILHAQLKALKQISQSPKPRAKTLVNKTATSVSSSIVIPMAKVTSFLTDLCAAVQGLGIKQTETFNRSRWKLFQEEAAKRSVLADYALSQYPSMQALASLLSPPSQLMSSVRSSVSSLNSETESSLASSVDHVAVVSRRPAPLSLATSASTFMKSRLLASGLIPAVPMQVFLAQHPTPHHHQPHANQSHPTSRVRARLLSLANDAGAHKGAVSGGEGKLRANLLNMTVPVRNSSKKALTEKKQAEGKISSGRPASFLPPIASSSATAQTLAAY